MRDITVLSFLFIFELECSTFKYVMMLDVKDIMYKYIHDIFEIWMLTHTKILRGICHDLNVNIFSQFNST